MRRSRNNCFTVRATFSNHCETLFTSDFRNVSTRVARSNHSETLFVSSQDGDVHTRLNSDFDDKLDRAKHANDGVIINGDKTFVGLKRNFGVGWSLVRVPFVKFLKLKLTNARKNKGPSFEEPSSAV